MKKSNLVKSLCVTLVVSALLFGAGFFLLVDGEGSYNTGSLVETSRSVQENSVESGSNYNSGVEKVLASGVAIKSEDSSDNNKSADPASSQQTASGNNQAQEPVAAAGGQSSVSAPVDHKKDAEAAQATSAHTQPVEQQTAGSSSENKQEEPVVASNSGPVETKSEQPSSAPEPVIRQTSTAVIEESAVPSVPPVTYSWGSSRNYTFRTEVKVTNNGSDTSQNVVVAVPLLESTSPYQTISLKSVNYSVVSSSGRVSTFNLGDIAPGETKTIVADINVTVRTVSINSTNDTVGKARQAYEQYKGSGNCRTLAQGFISKCREMGITAREVVGYARPERGAMTSGSLQGCRHSWAEFYVDGLGWVPVDLTFQYFGEFPHASHIVEGYGDQSISINYSGGSLGASWSNQIL